MHVLFLSPEVWPFSHVGGLSEVSHDLPLALGRAGHEVAVITPGLNINGLNSEGLKDLDIVLDVPVSYSVQRANVYLREMGPGVNAYLIGHENMFDRDGLYGNQFGDYEDNAERFVFFSRACLELAKAMDWQVDIVHANDWTTGLVPLYMRTHLQGCRLPSQGRQRFYSAQYRQTRCFLALRHAPDRAGLGMLHSGID